MIHRQDDGGVAILRLEHGKANALDVEFCDLLTKTFLEIAETGARAVVVTGTGGIFSAGVDLLRVLDGGTAYLGAFMPALHRALHAVFTCPLPVVAAINGHAIAGGAIIAAAADLRFMAEGKARIGVPELSVGVPFPLLALEIFRSFAPAQHFQRLIILGTTIEPDEAHRIGLLDHVVPAPALLPDAVAAARTLAAIPSLSFALTKRAIRAPVLARYAADGPAHDAQVTEAWSSPAVLAAVQAAVTQTIKRPR